jgi:hypothetical protein
MHGEPERRLQDLFLLHPHPEGEHHTRHVARDLSRELHTAAGREQVDHREVERAAAGRRHGLPARPADVHAGPLAAQHPRQRLPTLRVAVDQQDLGLGLHYVLYRSKPRTIPGPS